MSGYTRLACDIHKGQYCTHYWQGSLMCKYCLAGANLFMAEHGLDHAPLTLGEMDHEMRNKISQAKNQIDRALASL
jgi:hypothetical protein